MSVKIENLKNLDYELICNIFSREYDKSIPSKIQEFKFRHFDLIRENYLCAKVDYLIISANPILSSIVAKYLKEKEIENVFINNVFIEDNFNYGIVNDIFLKKISKTLNVAEVQNLYSFFKSTNCRKYYYTADKNISLSSNKKYKDEWVFSCIKHVNKLNVSENYNSLWEEYKKSMNDEINKLMFEVKEGNFFYVLAKKIIILMDNNPYLLPELVNQKNNVFVFDPKKYNGKKFEEDINSFIEKK